MPKRQKLLIVIADGEHVRFVRPGADNSLHTRTAADSALAHKQSSALGSDKPGETFHTGSFAHHGVQPRHDPHTLEKEKFAHLVAHQINEAAGLGEFEELVIVAPAHSLNAIKDGLDGTASGKIVGTLMKDLIKVPDDELWPHVRSWVRPTHRPEG